MKSHSYVVVARNFRRWEWRQGICRSSGHWTGAIGATTRDPGAGPRALRSVAQSGAAFLCSPANRADGLPKVGSIRGAIFASGKKRAGAGRSGVTATEEIRGNHLRLGGPTVFGEVMGTVKARYEDKVLKPLGELDLKDGEEVEIDVHQSAVRKLLGIVRCWEGLEEAHEDYGDSDLH
jgi:predicted DNA-binding antitoxin AbrB/MazE fold protein